MNMKGRMGRMLRVAYFCAIGASFLTMLLFEGGAIGEGWLAVERQLEFVVATLMVLVTMGCIPLSLRFTHIRRVEAAAKVGDSGVDGRIFMVRVLLLGIPMFANTLLYYAFMSPRFGYMAIILLLCMLCIYPSIDNDKEDCQ